MKLRYCNNNSKNARERMSAQMNAPTNEIQNY